MTKELFIVVFVALTILGHNGSATADTLENLAASDFHVFLTKVTTDKKQFKEPVTSVVMEQLLDYPLSLPGLMASDDKEIEQNVLLLQDFRDYLLAKPSYETVLLADTVNRVVFISLSRRIISAGSISPMLKAQVQRLHDGGIDSSQITFIFEASAKPASEAALSSSGDFELPKLAKSSRVQTATDRANEHKLTGFYKLLMTATGTKSLDDALAQRKRKVAKKSSLLAEKDMSALLMLIWETDHHINLTLPLLAVYVEKCPNFRPDDDYRKIKTVLNLSATDRQQYGSYLTPATPGTEDTVRRLLQQVRQGKLDSFMGFHEAQKKLAFMPSKETLIQKTINDIESAKAQIKLLQSLSSEDTISIGDIRSYLRKDLFIPEDGGEYQVGRINQPACFICPDGQVISSEH